MSRLVTVAATQFSCTVDEARNIELAESLIRSAAIAGAQVILLPELFASTYFCQLQEGEKFDLATPVENSAFLRHFQSLSAELDVVLPVSFFEVSKTAHFNSVAVFDGGQYLGTYRKSHIPDGPGYTEKYYFTPGNTGFKVFNTRFCKLSVLICWDQWFPEAARCCCLEGAELIFYPTAIGSEPNNPGLFSRPHWQRTQCGHSAANLTPIVVSNRIGTEDKITFYGGSFITDGLGEIVKQFEGEQQSGMLLQTFDLDELLKQRRAWGVFRDRRPELYGSITTFDGCLSPPNLSPPVSLPAVVPSAKDQREEGLYPSLDGFFMPPEWEEHAACYMAWPYKRQNWSHCAVPVQREVAKLALNISKYEPVCMLVTPAEYTHALEALPVGCGVRLYIAEYDDIWVRDSGCTFIVPSGSAAPGKPRKLRAVEWEFNGWGSSGDLAVNLAIDNAVSGIMSRLSGCLGRGAVYKCPVVLEGGSFHVDGEGTMLTTEECLFNPNRANDACPRRIKQELEPMLKQYLGVQKVIWIPRGVYGDEDTNGHVDNLCTFVCPGHVLLTFPKDENDPQYAISKETLRILEESTDAKTRRFVVHKVAHPAPAMHYVQNHLDKLEPNANGTLLRRTGDRLAASYINFYLAGRKAIIMPRFGLPTDNYAREQIESIYTRFYPGIKVIQSDSKAILLGGGNIHCITQQQPK